MKTFGFILFGIGAVLFVGQVSGGSPSAGVFFGTLAMGIGLIIAFYNKIKVIEDGR